MRRDMDVGFLLVQQEADVVDLGDVKPRVWIGQNPGTLSEAANSAQVQT
jgi:hypothetical protein